MAEICFKDAYASINGVDLSDHVRSVTINYSAEMLDVTAMGDDSRNRLAGLKDWSLEVEFNQDFASGEVDATLFSLVGGSAVTVAVRPTSDAVSTTNPEFTGSALLESYSPLSGGVGDLAVVSATFQGTGDLTRSTA